MHHALFCYIATLAAILYVAPPPLQETLDPPRERGFPIVQHIYNGGEGQKLVSICHGRHGDKFNTARLKLSVWHTNHNVVGLSNDGKVAVELILFQLELLVCDMIIWSYQR